MREEEAHLPRGTSFDLRGQIETMQSSFFRLGLGMIFAVVLVYLLMTVNFQSWLDPFIILTALPGRHGWHIVDVVRHRHHSQRSVADGRHHVHRCGHREQYLMVTFANDERATIGPAREAMLLPATPGSGRC